MTPIPMTCPLILFPPGPQVHPTQALKMYREHMGLPHAKLAVLAFSATEFSIADPEDPLMMDISGLDSAVPRILRDFALGEL